MFTSITRERNGFLFIYLFSAVIAIIELSICVINRKSNRTPRLLHIHHTCDCTSLSLTSVFDYRNIGLSKIHVRVCWFGVSLFRSTGGNESMGASEFLFYGCISAYFCYQRCGVLMCWSGIGICSSIEVFGVVLGNQSRISEWRCTGVLLAMCQNSLFNYYYYFLYYQCVRVFVSADNEASLALVWCSTDVLIWYQSIVV